MGIQHMYKKEVEKGLKMIRHMTQWGDAWW